MAAYASTECCKAGLASKITRHRVFQSIEYFIPAQKHDVQFTRVLLLCRAIGRWADPVRCIKAREIYLC